MIPVSPVIPVCFPGHADRPQCHPGGSGCATGGAASASQLQRGDPRNILERSRIGMGMAPRMTAPIPLPSVSPPWENIPPQSPGSIPGAFSPPLWEWGGDPKPLRVAGAGGGEGSPQILPLFQNTSRSLCSWLLPKSDTEDVGMGSCLHRSQIPGLRHPPPAALPAGMHWSPSQKPGTPPNSLSLCPWACSQGLHLLAAMGRGFSRGESWAIPACRSPVGCWGSLTLGFRNSRESGGLEWPRRVPGAGRVTGASTSARSLLALFYLGNKLSLRARVS